MNNKQYIKYSEALEIASNFLKKEQNLKEFCSKHKIGYENTIQIKNMNTQKEFPNLVLKILIIFGTNYTIELMFKNLDYERK